MRDIFISIIGAAVMVLGVAVYLEALEINGDKLLVEHLSKNGDGRSPSLTEVFHLRSECAALGEKILGDDAIGSALTKSVVSKYDPKANRCYVELSINSADLRTPIDSAYANYTLYDGQTGELLAYARSQNGQQAGMVFAAHKAVPNATPHDDALEFITDMMSEER